MSIELLLVLQLAAAGVMTAVGWMVQLLVYPAFAVVADGRTEQDWRRYHAHHSSRITWVVAPAMSVQLACAVLLAVQPTPAIVANLVLVAGTWLVTAWVAMSHHRRLAAAFDAGVLRGLLRGNLLRTIIWTVQCGLAAWCAAAGIA